MILLWCSHVDTWRWVWFQPAPIILTWSVGEYYHPQYIHLPTDCLDLWTVRTVRALTVSYAAALMMRHLSDLHLPFYLGITIGLVVLNSSISIVAILAFDIHQILSDFYLFDCWVPARKAWWFVPMSGGERDGRCVLLKDFWVIVADDSLKASHVSTRME